MNINGGPVTRAYPSIGEGRSPWNCSAMGNMLSVYADDYDQRQQQRDVFIIQAMPLPPRRTAWARARGFLRVAGCWTDGGCNDSPEVKDWSPLFRRFVVWLA